MRRDKEKRRRIKSYICEGLSNKQIADKMNLSEASIKWYVEEFRREFGMFGPANHRLFMVMLIKENRGESPDSKETHEAVELLRKRMKKWQAHISTGRSTRRTRLDR